MSENDELRFSIEQVRSIIKLIGYLNIFKVRKEDLEDYNWANTIKNDEAREALDDIVKRGKEFLKTSAIDTAVDAEFVMSKEQYFAMYNCIEHKHFIDQEMANIKGMFLLIKKLYFTESK